LNSAYQEEKKLMKTSLSKFIFPFIILFILATSSCNLPQKSVTTPDLAYIEAQTQTAIAVNQFLTATPPNTNILPTGSPTASSSQTVSKPPAGTPLPSPSISIPSPTLESTKAPSNCTNAAKFETETIPDNSVFSTGQEFIKTWTLRNNGTCTWTPNYSLVYEKGDQMNGTSPSPIGKTVPPGQTIQIYLPQKAPQSPGNYQGFWKLRAESGQVFGLGQNTDVAFWVKIVVIPGSNNSTTNAPFGGPQNLGAPTWTETFDQHSSPWYLGTDSGVDYDIKDGRLVITAIEPTGDQWRVAQPGFLADFYLQAKFQLGPTCTGTDGYGLIVRAPDKPNGSINSGYIFSLSCDGKYRIYRMDNGNYHGIQNWTFSPAIKSGSNQINVLGVYAEGTRFQLYINGIQITEIEDSTYSNGLFGLVIRSEATNNLQVFVDDVAAWVLK
jgi:Ig-like domain from next to BRCA1 gene